MRDVVAQGPSKARRMYNVDGDFISGAMLMLRETAHKTGAFPERTKCKRVTAMSQGTGGKGCLYRHTSSPGLTATRRRSAGRQGEPSPLTSRRLVRMPCRRESSCSRQNLSRQAGTQDEEVQHAWNRK